MKQILGITLLIGALAITGCSYKNLVPKQEEPEEVTTAMAVPYNANALNNFYLGRQYTAQMRYELAREHYLMALASARHEALRESLVHELDAVDRLIKTVR